MKKESKKNFFVRIITNTYLVNFVLMIIIAVALIFGVLYYMKIYTQHDKSITIPKIKGLNLQDAEKMLSDASLRYEVVDSVYQTNGVAGTILDLVPKENAQVKKGRTIFLTIQSNLEPSVAVPELEFASLRQAEALLSAIGFKNVNIEYQSSEFENLVLDVFYNGIHIKNGQKIPKSAKITLVVGSGSTTGENDSIISVDNDQFTEFEEITE